MKDVRLQRQARAGRRPAAKRIALICILVCVATACGADEPRSRKVLIVGIDGCRPDALLKANAPHLKKLIEEGAFSDQAKTGDITVSGPGWTSMLTGVWREKHGVRDNKFENADLKNYPHLFTRLKSKKPKAVTASVVHWAPINQKIITACDHVVTRKTDKEVTEESEKVLTLPELDVLFVHLDDVDGAGHTHGFHPKVERYLKAIEQTDLYMGRLREAIRKRPTASTEDWLILVSTDHGGNGKGHGRDTPEERTIFVILHGPGVRQGRLPAEAGVVDVAATALDFLGVEIEPKWRLDGRSLLAPLAMGERRPRDVAK